MELKISPLYLMLPLIISVSFALMLPVATPTNAIIFAHGHIKIRDMVNFFFLFIVLELKLLIIILYKLVKNYVFFYKFINKGSIF